MAFTLPGFLARLSMSMWTVATVILVHSVTGSYGIAGAVAGTLGLTSAVTSPLFSQWVDRIGQGRLLVPAAVAHAVGYGALIACCVLRAPVWTFFLTSVLAAAPRLHVASLLRARWSHLVAEPALLRTAYAFETVLDELAYSFGPLLVAVAATALHPAAGAVLALVLLLLGSVLLATQRRTEPPPQRSAGHRAGAVLRVRGMLTVIGVLLGTGTMFGAVNVTVVAYAIERDAPAAAGGVLTAWGLASMVFGLVYGSFGGTRRPDRSVLLATLAFSAVTPLLLLADSLALLTAVVVVSGITVSPVLITAYAFVSRVAPRASLTEAFTWAGTSISLASAFSVALTGWVIDAYGARPGFAVAVAGSLLAVVAACAGQIRGNVAADAPQ